PAVSDPRPDRHAVARTRGGLMSGPRRSSLSLVAALLPFAALAFAPLYLAPYHLLLAGRFLSLGILAMGIVMVWGQAGVLPLGQGVFFGLGGYAGAMHLKPAPRAARA